jgi:hypothetical protein
MGKYQEDEVIRKQIDKLLQKIAKVEANLGIDSSKQEWTKAKSKQQDYLEKIKLLDEEFYNVLVP